MLLPKIGVGVGIGVEAKGTNSRPRFFSSSLCPAAYEGAIRNI